MSGETQGEVSEARRGRTVSPDTRAKISEALRGRPRSAETRAKIAEAARRRRDAKRAEVEQQDTCVSVPMTVAIQNEIEAAARGQGMTGTRLIQYVIALWLIEHRADKAEEAAP